MSPPGDRNPVVVFFGWLLIAVGGLIAFTSGACTVVFAASGLNMTDGAGIANWVLLCLAVGALPMVVGAGLVFIGWLMLRRRATRD